MNNTNLILSIHTFIIVIILILIIIISKNQSHFLEQRVQNLEKRVQNMSEMILEETDGK